MSAATIKTQDDLMQEAQHLAALCPRMAYALESLEPLRSRQRSDGFGALAQIIVGQQISISAANAIWQRLEIAGFITPSAVSRASDADLRSCGLSGQKIKYMTALARAEIDYQSFYAQSDEDVRAQLLPITGIGPWSVDIYLMFCLGRADVMPSGDLALQVGAQMLYDLPERPTAKALAQHSDAWRPHRSVAAHILWAYYAYVKNKEGIL